MSKILLTGMTASHSSADANTKNLQFAQALNLALKYSGHEVDWIDPDIHWTAQDLDERYDAVLVGISPIMGLPANRCYGALNTIGQLYFSDKLTLFIDAPEPAQIGASLASVARGSSDLFKPFFSYRKFFKEAQNGEPRKRIDSAVELLNTMAWPTTIYPMLPWEATPLEKGLPANAGKPLGMNLDSFLLNHNAYALPDREKIWAIDSYRTKWAISTARGLVYPTTPMRPDKGKTDGDVQDLMLSSMGALISPQKSGSTWWSYRYIQAMNCGAPIATEWRESSRIGNSWAYLASGIESLSEVDRHDLAGTQRHEYVSAIHSITDAAFELESLLGVN